MSTEVILMADPFVRPVSLNESGLRKVFQEVDSDADGVVSVEEFALLCKRLKLYLTPSEQSRITQDKMSLPAVLKVFDKSRHVTLMKEVKDHSDKENATPLPFALQRIKSLERKQSKTHELKSAKVFADKTDASEVLHIKHPHPNTSNDELLSVKSSPGFRDSLNSSQLTGKTSSTATSANSNIPQSLHSKETQGELIDSPLGQTATERSDEEDKKESSSTFPKLEIRRVSAASERFPQKAQSADLPSRSPDVGPKSHYLQTSQTEKQLGSGRSSLLQNMMTYIPHPSISPRLTMPLRMPFNKELAPLVHQDSFTMLSPRTREEMAKNQLGLFTRTYGAFFGHKEIDQFPEVRREYRPQRAGVYQDMDSPLSHYFISSGHNSYLKGNQLTSASSVKPIADALDRGCRVIELDVWSGTKEPYVVHGFTMSKKVLFSRCIKTVRKHAFRATDFPLIITLENHCNAKNKEVMVKILLEELGDMLYRRPKDQKWDEFPSPNELRGYILIRDKHDIDLAEELQNIPQQKKMDMSNLLQRPIDFKTMDVISEVVEDPEELKDLISIVNVKHSVAESSAVPASSSRGEAALEELNHDLTRTLTHTQKHLLRTYPGAKRLDSSNYDPMLGWGCGAQIVAMNWQSPGPIMWAYQGMFRDNGHCGYVKKPEWMLGDVTQPGALDQPEKLLRIRLLSARHMRHRGIKENHVTLEMFGIGKDARSQHSAPVRGYDCCTWDQEFLFKLQKPDCAVLVFTLKTKETFRGQVALPINNLATGKFQMHLLNKSGQPLPGNRRHTQLVVDISIQNLTGNLRKVFGDL